jgi:predicted dinucleotide-binding enzyme
MTIAILGAGNVGQALGERLRTVGERVHFGVPSPRKYSSLIGERADVGTVEQAVAASDVAILAVPYEAALEIAGSIGDWRDRVLIDATNPLAPGLSGLVVGTTTSGAEQIAQAAQNARVVKAFNTTGFDNMRTPGYPGGRTFMPVCADDADARAWTIALANKLGFEAVDFGALAGARYLEPFAMTWIHLAIKQGFGRDFAFGLLRRGG